MKITKFAQSCVLIETDNKRILIDPGNIQYEESFIKDEWANIDILLVTHKHKDHCHIDAIREIIKNPKTVFYTTQEVADAYPEISPQIVKAGDVLNIDNIKIEVVKAVHGYIPLFKDKTKAIKENVGYIIDDGFSRIYQTSDTICFGNDYKCDVILIPFVGHGVVMGPWDAALFAKETGAKLVIPIHYDNPLHPGDIGQFEKELEGQEMNYKILSIGESAGI